jgi:hypothetical protein
MNHFLGGLEMNSLRAWLLAGLCIAAATLSHGAAAQAVGSAFTYQGELRASGQPANGAYDFQFRLFNANTAGAQIGTTLIVSSVGVAGGLFTVPLDFGPGQFAGDAQWLEIAVRAAGAGTFEVLTPRTAITAAPYALGAVAALPNAVTGTSVVDGSIGAADINPSQIQRRVVGTCAANAGVQGIGGDGTVVCGTFAGNPGTVTNIQTGAGLTGGPITSTGTIAVAPGGVGLTQINTGEVQARIASACPPGQFVRGVASDGTPTCAPDSVGTGTLTSIQTGPGLQGGPITAAGTISVAPEGIQRSMVAPGAIGATQIDSAAVQRRVLGTCSVGQVITAINADGSVGCADAPAAPREVLVRPGRIAGAIFGTTSPGGLPYFLTNGLVPITNQWVRCATPDCTGVPQITTLAPWSAGANAVRTSAAWIGGLPLLVGTEGTGTGWTVRLDYCTDLACSSPVSRTVDSFGGNNFVLLTSANAILVPADGRPVVVYRRLEAPSSTLFLAKCNDSECTSSVRSVVVDNSPPIYGAASIVATPSGGLLVAGGLGAIVTAACTDASCTSLGSLASIPIAGAGTIIPIAVTSAPDGRPVTAFSDGAGAVRVFKCENSQCVAGQVNTVVAGGGGASVAIAIGSDGLPLLSVRAAGSAGSPLTVMHCADPACQAIHVDTLIAGGTLDAPNPIVVPSNARPVVAAGGSAPGLGATVFQFYSCATPTCR